MGDPSIASLMQVSENSLQLTNLADSEVAGLEGNFAVENGRQFESEEHTVLIQEVRSEEHTVWIQDQRI